MKQKLTDKQKAFRKSLLAAVHTSKRYKEHFEHCRDDYEAMLNEYFQVGSAADLSIPELVVLRDYLNYRRDNLLIQSTKAQQDYIWAAWQKKARDPSLSALRNLVANKVGKTVMYLSALSKSEAVQVISIINNMR